jgi:glyoxylate reductase
MKELGEVSINEDDHPFSESELLAAMREYEVICPCVTDKISARVLSVTDRKAEFIANFGVGYDHIDIDAAREHGVIVTNTPGVLTHGTADLAMTLLLMIARRAGEGERLVRSGGWHGWYPTQLMGASVTGKTLGIVGMGRIGMAVAEKAHFGFGMKILYSNRNPLAREKLGNIPAEFFDDLDAMLAQSDFVSLHCPGGDNTRNLINADRLESMKQGAFLINTSRGDVVDTAALIAALQNGQIAGAGLDVYVGEPNVPAELMALENVVLLPHMGSATLETRTAMGLRVVSNVKDWLSGTDPRDRVV